MTDSLPIPLSAPLTPAQQTMLVNLVRRAARAEIMPRFRTVTRADASTKSGPHDLVTEADHQAEAMLARGLQRMFPHALIVGEEAVAAKPALREDVSDAELAFIIDPVDGTWNFVHGLPLFGVIIAVTRFGRPVLGLLYDPVSDDWVIADEATPARMATVQGAERLVRVSGGGALAELQGYMHFSLMPKDRQEKLAPLLPALGRCNALRCSCHEYRLLAQGAVDFVMSEVLNPWDHAAGVLICQQAGGVARMLDGRDYNTSITQGTLLSAANEATWLSLKDHFACLLES
ncbi:Fructose-1, 6-bisphosphatase/inositol-1-monophosphatase [Roseovarius sp. EC-HK134]|uniref:inositol monophosphatase family protein n=1 Tax=unclassified Roseovarius TaxID=2614913 RepID=UPI001253C9D7|nr:MULTISPECIES: inositol monophosphatase [unclassified Roseovarius]VVT24413.1 Fructose-1, 6-bisphosphatase/inositol-1-monophosphatase [Roseovarius sp. EC-SD190]VVT24651.1 Fructose-1, 6-bisphosphatase/inositol-1-monophosphatase [Roseovarius sp. EC-HK134]